MALAPVTLSPPPSACLPHSPTTINHTIVSSMSPFAALSSSASLRHTCRIDCLKLGLLDFNPQHPTDEARGRKRVTAIPGSIFPSLSPYRSGGAWCSSTWPCSRWRRTLAPMQQHLACATLNDHCNKVLQWPRDGARGMAVFGVVCCDVIRAWCIPTRVLWQQHAVSHKTPAAS